MKQIVFIINVLLCFCMSYAMAQEKEVFPTKNAEWKVRCNGCFNYGGINYGGYYHVNDYTISLTERDTLCLGNTYSIFTEREREGGLRVENSRVWCTFNWEHEFLLYDFDVKEGDTIVHGVVYKDYPYFIPESIPQGDSIGLVEHEFISIVERVEKENKTIHVTYYERPLIILPGYPEDLMWHWGNDIWQEGIGSLNGLFINWATMGPIPVGYKYWEFQSYTLKMTQNSEVRYYNPDIPEIPEYPEISYGIDEIYTDQFEVQYDETLRTLSIISKTTNIEGILCLYDLSGKTVMNIPFKGDCKVSIPSTLKGYHLCTISQNNAIVFSSKIKL